MGSVAAGVHTTSGLLGTVTVADARATDGGPGGLQAGPFRAAGGATIAPGQSAQEVFSLSSSLPRGPWQASFTMVSGLITKTEKVTLSFNDTAATTTAGKSFPIVPVAAGGGVLVLLLAAAFFIAKSRPNHAPRSAHPARRRCAFGRLARGTSRGLPRSMR